MEFLERIEPYLLSDDPIVLEFVLHVLDEYPVVPPEWTERLLKEALHSKEKQYPILTHLKNHRFNDGAVQALIEGLQQKDKKVGHLFTRLIDKIGPEQAIKFKTELETELQPFIQPEKWEFYHLLAEGADEDVWGEYGQTLNDLDNAKAFDDELFLKAKKLAEVIAQNGWISENDIDIVMKQELEEEWFTFEGILNVYFIKLLQLKKFIPQLTSLLVRDDDVLLEEVTDALSFFQSDEVVKAVAPHLIDMDSDIMTFFVIQNIKTPLAAKVLLDARNHIEEDSRELLFESLCFQLTPDVVPAMEEMLKEGGFTTFITELETSLYGFYQVMGLTHPDLEKWKRISEERNEYFLKDMGLLEPVPKVGRNDPCICGSGKKYKKCCGA